MKISADWLSDYVEVPENVEDILTSVGLNVDEVIESEISGEILTGKVVENYKHPNADKLQICEVDLGGKIVRLITADMNVKTGDFVIVALPGAKLHGGRVVEAKDMRGVKSEGMLCSLEELGIEEKSDRVFVFDNEVEIGKNVIDLFKLNDKVFDVEVTPNRGDALSYIGVARDLAAKTKNDLNIPQFEIQTNNKSTKDFVDIEIEDVEGCPRYAAMVIENIEVKESPVWIKRRLMASGIRPINNIVDATNYVMLETGHPIHAFDYHLIESKKIVVRKAKKGEKELLLDEKEYTFNGIETLITDGGEKIIAVGGVMGAMNSGVTEDTKDVLIEVAFFDPVRIRKTAKGLKIQSDASYRFERGVDPNDVEFVMKRVVSLIQHLAGGTATKDILDVYPKKLDGKEVILRKKKIYQILGIEVPDDEVEDILSRLGFHLKRIENSWKVKVPSFRMFDVQREIDLIEEIGRIYGYEKVPPERTKIWSGIGGKSDWINFRREIIEFMKGMGFDEVLTFSFASSKVVNDWKVTAKKPVAVQNPITDDMDLMRESLVYNLMEVAKYNFTHQIKSLKIFEIGKVFWKDENIKEKTYIGALAYGLENEDDYTDKRPVSFYTFKGVLDELFERFGMNVEYEPKSINGFVPTRTAMVMAYEKEIGFIGMIDPDLLKRYDIKTDVYYFELDLEELFDLRSKLPKYRPSPVFPSIRRDVALLINENTKSSKVIAKIKELGEGLVEDVKVIDVYRGKGVPEGFTSVTFSIIFRSSKRTLSDEEVNELFEKIVKNLEENFKIKRRF